MVVSQKELSDEYNYRINFETIGNRKLLKGEREQIRQEKERRKHNCASSMMFHAKEMAILKLMQHDLNSHEEEDVKPKILALTNKINGLEHDIELKCGTMEHDRKTVKPFKIRKPGTIIGGIYTKRLAMRSMWD